LRSRGPAPAASDELRAIDAPTSTRFRGHQFLRYFGGGVLALLQGDRHHFKDLDQAFSPRVESAPKETFNLVMRLYWSKKEIMSGAWYHLLSPPAREPVLEDCLQ
jgi:hypothetical protein